MCSASPSARPRPARWRGRRAAVLLVLRRGVSSRVVESKFVKREIFWSLGPGPRLTATPVAGEHAANPREHDPQVTRERTPPDARVAVALGLADAVHNRVRCTDATGYGLRAAAACRDTRRVGRQSEFYTPVPSTHSL